MTVVIIRQENVFPTVYPLEGAWAATFKQNLAKVPCQFEKKQNTTIVL